MNVRRSRNSPSLDELLDGEPHGTFHDSTLVRVSVDYVERRVVAEFEISVGDPMSQVNASRLRDYDAHPVTR